MVKVPDLFNTGQWRTPSTALTRTGTTIFIPTVQQRGAAIIEARGDRSLRRQCRHRSYAELGARDRG